MSVRARVRKQNESARSRSHSHSVLSLAAIFHGGDQKEKALQCFALPVVLFFYTLLTASCQRCRKTKPRRLRDRAFSFVGVRRLELPASTSRT